MNPPPSKPKSDLAQRRVGALWLRTSLSGNKYLSGEIDIKRGDTVEKLYVTVMKNNSQFKVEGSKRPDYEVFLQAPRGLEKPKDELLDDTGPSTTVPNQGGL